MFTSTLALTVATFILIAVVFPYFLAVLAVAIPIYYFAQDFYRSTSREVARLNSITRSPIYALFGETLNGLSTIRAYGAMSSFEEDLMRRLDTNQRAYYVSITIQRWIALRLEVTSAFCVLASAFFAVSLNGSMPAGLLSLAVTYSLQVTSVFNWCVRQAAETENQMNSVERLLYYEKELEHEAAAVIPDHRPPPGWPGAGAIEMQKLEMRYREDLPLVLKGINLSVKAGEKIGIVGRTGAGKVCFNFLRKGGFPLQKLFLTFITYSRLSCKLCSVSWSPAVARSSLTGSTHRRLVCRICVRVSLLSLRTPCCFREPSDM